MINGNISAVLYLVSSVFFILSLGGLSSQKTSLRGNLYGIIGMGLAVITTILSPLIEDYIWIFISILSGGFIGVLISQKIKMTVLPQLIAAFHSLVGLAAVFISGIAFYQPESYDIGIFGQIQSTSLFEISLGISIGMITFVSSIMVFMKLQGIVRSMSIFFIGQNFLNIVLIIIELVLIFLLVFIDQSQLILWFLIVISFILGIFLVIPIAGVDMPVVISILNSFSGWTSVGIGFTFNNYLLIIVGALIGSSGTILSYIMCKGMNRSIFDVIFRNFNIKFFTINTLQEKKVVNYGTPKEASFILQNASSVIIVPGYGMAVAQAHHVLYKITDYLKKRGIITRYAIHPVAGRMPGHMNVLLAEANISYEDVLELGEINQDFSSTDVAFVIGANDVTNPIAKSDSASPIYGMPVLDVGRAKIILFLKRSLSSGYAGIDNNLFYCNNTIMLFGDAKEVCKSIIEYFEN